MSPLNRSLTWLAAIKQSRIENTLAHDLPFRANDSLVFIWPALNRRMTVAVVARESRRGSYERTKTDLLYSFATFRTCDGMGSESGQAAGSNMSSRAQWSAALRWVAFWHGRVPHGRVLGPYRFSWNPNHHLWLLNPLGGERLINMDGLMSLSFCAGLHGDQSRRGKLC